MVLDLLENLKNYAALNPNFAKAVEFIENNDLVKSEKDWLKYQMLRHIILSHHGTLEYGAAVPPMSIEAHIVNKADGVDASVEQVIEQSRKLGNVKFTDRIYTLGNRPHLTVQYVKEVLRSVDDDLPF